MLWTRWKSGQTAKRTDWKIPKGHSNEPKKNNEPKDYNGFWREHCPKKTAAKLGSHKRQGFIYCKKSETMPKPKFKMEKLCHDIYSKFGQTSIISRGISGYLKLGRQVVMWRAATAAAPSILPKTGWAIANPAHLSLTPLISHSYQPLFGLDFQMENWEMWLFSLFFWNVAKSALLFKSSVTVLPVIICLLK